MANPKYDLYSFVDEQEFIDTLNAEGFEYEAITTDFLIHKDEESLDVHYAGNIVTNYPIENPDPENPTWEPVYSAEVYVLSARIGNIKLPSNHKVGGNDRKYYYDYTNRFAGEGEPE